LSRAVLLLAALALAACGGPLGWVPGGKLEGEPTDVAIADWSFVKRVENLQLETDPADPYSVNIWFVTEDAKLWVFAGGGETSTWAKNLFADPHAIVRIEGKLYPRRAVRVTDPEEILHVEQLYLEKYDYTRDVNGAFKPVIIRLDPP
jgi:hypothetical protein